MAKVQKGVLQLPLLLAMTIIVLVTGILAYQRVQVRYSQDKISSKGAVNRETTPLNSPTVTEQSTSQNIAQPGWKTYTTGKPLNINFSAPQDFTVEYIYEDKDTSKTWGVNILTDKGGNMLLCTGCDFTSSDCREYKCTVKKTEKLDNGYYNVNVYKSNENQLADIIGSINKNIEFGVELMITTDDNHVPTAEEYAIIDTILNSVSSN